MQNSKRLVFTSVWLLLSTGLALGQLAYELEWHRSFPAHLLVHGAETKAVYNPYHQTITVCTGLTILGQGNWGQKCQTYDAAGELVWEFEPTISPGFPLFLRWTQDIAIGDEGDVYFLNGGYYIAGHEEAGMTIVQKVSGADGSLLWEQVHPNSEERHGEPRLWTWGSDGSIYMSGRTNYFWDDQNPEMFLMKMNTDGVLLWDTVLSIRTRIYQLDLDENSNSLLFTWHGHANWLGRSKFSTATGESLGFDTLFVVPGALLTHYTDKEGSLYRQGSSPPEFRVEKYSKEGELLWGYERLEEPSAPSGGSGISNSDWADFDSAGYLYCLSDFSVPTYEHRGSLVTKLDVEGQRVWEFELPNPFYGRVFGNQAINGRLRVIGDRLLLAATDMEDQVVLMEYDTAGQLRGAHPILGADVPYSLVVDEGLGNVYMIAGSIADEDTHVTVSKFRPIYTESKELPHPLALRLYPVPAVTYLQIEGAVLEKAVRLDVFNSLGQPMYQHMLSGQQAFTLSIEGWPTGMYYLRLYDKLGKYETMNWLKAGIPGEK